MDQLDTVRVQHSQQREALRRRLDAYRERKSTLISTLQNEIQTIFAEATNLMSRQEKMLTATMNADLDSIEQNIQVLCECKDSLSSIVRDLKDSSVPLPSQQALYNAIHVCYVDVLYDAQDGESAASLRPPSGDDGSGGVSQIRIPYEHIAQFFSSRINTKQRATAAEIDSASTASASNPTVSSSKKSMPPAKKSIDVDRNIDQKPVAIKRHPIRPQQQAYVQPKRHPVTRKPFTFSTDVCDHDKDSGHVHHVPQYPHRDEFIRLVRQDKTNKRQPNDGYPGANEPVDDNGGLDIDDNEQDRSLSLVFRDLVQVCKV